MIRLKDVAHGRSGDKGNHANIGVIAYSAEGYAYLGRHLTPERVAGHFRSLGGGAVERWALPGIRAYNFLLRDILGGGASDSLRTDTQGKALATALLEMELPDPEDPRALAPASRGSGSQGNRSDTL